SFSAPTEFGASRRNCFLPIPIARTILETHRISAASASAGTPLLWQTRSMEEDLEPSTSLRARTTFGLLQPSCLFRTIPSSFHRASRSTEERWRLDQTTVTHLLPDSSAWCTSSDSAKGNGRRP